MGTTLMDKMGVKMESKVGGNMGVLVVDLVVLVVTTMTRLTSGQMKCRE